MPRIEPGVSVPTSPPSPAVNPNLRRESPVATPPAVDPKAPGRPALRPPDRSRLMQVPPHPDAVAIGSGSFTPEKELEILHDLFRGYTEEIGSLPVGESNAQFMNALRGANPASWGWFPYEHPRLNEEGALTDEWGTPYFFHKISRTHLEIRSAGNDQEMYTEDDLVFPEPPSSSP